MDDMPTSTRRAAATTALVLDMRENQRNTADGLRVTNATATGLAGGYTVESQRRSAGKVKGLSMRLTAPDGRTLDVVGYQGISAANAHAPVTSALSEAVGYAFRTRRTTKQTDAAVAAIEAVITTGLECLSARISGHDALHRVQCAANGLDYALVSAFLAEHAALYGTSSFYRAPAPAKAGWLIEAGFTPADLREWFPTNDYNSRSHVTAMGAARRNGWTRADRTAVQANLLAHKQEHDDGAYVSTAELDTWATIPPGSARTAARAGLTPADARRLLRTGEYDEPALRLVTALLDNPLPDAGA